MSRRVLFFLPLVLVLALFSSCRPPSAVETSAAPVLVPAPTPTPEPPVRVDVTFPVMLGIDTLEAEGFAAVRGKRIGLLTHPAGVNRRGESTVTVLQRAPDTRLVCLFAPEHGLYGTDKASAQIEDSTDPRTGLPVYSLHGRNRKPTPAQLQGLDALVIDLQDIGVRSYTYNVVMRYAIDSCVRQGVEIIVLDRPNPLGGEIVDGPLLDRANFSGVGAFPMPYVHGLTLGELARWAAATPGLLDAPEEKRAAARLTVVPMRGWRRTMRWPDTGLTFVATSQNVPDFRAVVGYAALGLGCESSGFTHGLGTPHPFRSLAFKGKTSARIEKDLVALKLPGLKFRTIAGADAGEKSGTRVWVEVSDWTTWRPTELSFHLHRLACRYQPPNPFAKLTGTAARSFVIHVGSTAWWQALQKDGAKVDVDAFLKRWRTEADAFRESTRPFHLYR
ncbi:MAG TPA: DUF1343 domain-containing protein [Opitutaceae bacterium]|nr:DUF1343 domain-containing protein [Opitutaceae bacterium]